MGDSSPAAVYASVLSTFSSISAFSAAPSLSFCAMPSSRAASSSQCGAGRRPSSSCAAGRIDQHQPILGSHRSLLQERARMHRSRPQKRRIATQETTS